MTFHLKSTLRSVAGEFLVTTIFISVVLSMLINSSRAMDPILANTLVPGIVVAFVATAIIYAFADVSGAHFNPAVTTGFIVTGKIDILKGAMYIAAQLLGALAATGLQFVIFPNNIEGFPTIQQVIPAGVPETTPVWQALIMEIFLTFLLVYIIFATAVDAPAAPKLTKVNMDLESGTATGKTDVEAPAAASTAAKPAGSQLVSLTGTTKNNFAPLAIGVTLGFLCFLGGSSSGGAFNPARVFGPSVLCNNFNSHWVYWVGDLVGGAMAASIQTWIFSRNNGLLKPCD